MNQATSDRPSKNATSEAKQKEESSLSGIVGSLITIWIGKMVIDELNSNFNVTRSSLRRL